jgi:hypothetical protein
LAILDITHALITKTIAQGLFKRTQGLAVSLGQKPPIVVIFPAQPEGRLILGRTNVKPITRSRLLPTLSKLPAPTKYTVDVVVGRVVALANIFDRKGSNLFILGSTSRDKDFDRERQSLETYPCDAPKPGKYMGYRLRTETNGMSQTVKITIQSFTKMDGFRDKESMAKMDPYTFSGTWAGPKVAWKGDYYEGFSRLYVTARGERMQNGKLKCHFVSKRERSVRSPQRPDTFLVYFLDEE